MMKRDPMGVVLMPRGFETAHDPVRESMLASGCVAKALPIRVSSVWAGESPLAAAVRSAAKVPSARLAIATAIHAPPKRVHERNFLQEKGKTLPVVICFFLSLKANTRILSSTPSICQ